MPELLGTLADYLRDDLVCAMGTDTGDFADRIEAGEIDLALDTFEACHLGDHTWTDAFDIAFAAAGGELTATHVANDDAMLQAALYAAWEETGEVGSCDPGHETCAGPTWFYDR